MVIANAIGSNVANILLVLGVLAVVFAKISTAWKKLGIDLPILMVLSLVAGIFLWNGWVGHGEGLLLTLFLLFYLIFMFRIQQPVQFLGQKTPPRKVNIKTILILLLSVVTLYFSAKYTVEAAVQLALLFGLSYSAVGATLVALGTSLPELSVSIVAGLRGKNDIAIGNIIGSNIFNLAGVIGLPALIFGVPVEQNILFFVYPFMLLATVIFIFFIRDHKVQRNEGIILLIAYIIFLAKMLNWF